MRGSRVRVTQAAPSFPKEFKRLRSLGRLRAAFFMSQAFAVYSAAIVQPVARHSTGRDWARALSAGQSLSRPDGDFVRARRARYHHGRRAGADEWQRLAFGAHRLYGERRRAAPETGRPRLAAAFGADCA